MGKSSIEWTDETWNPVTGCSKVSPGCAHCYAEAYTERMAGQPGWIAEHRPWTPANAAHNVILHPERRDQPLRWRRPRMVFVNSMSDLFHEAIPRHFIRDVFHTMSLAPQHTFQVLTKRPERMLEEIRDFGLWSWARGSEHSNEPLPNVWLGTSIENRRFIGRADLLRDTPAAVRFISAEPLLGPLMVYEEPEDGYPAWDWSRSLNLDGIDWLIVGGESGPRHRPMQPGWVRDLQVHADGNGTAFFFKQWGGRTPKAGGRELDGRTWDEMPTRRSLAGRAV